MKIANNLRSVYKKLMAKEHVQSWVTKNDTDNSEVHHEDYKQQGFEFE